MKYTARMYADALYEMIEESPKRSKTIIEELITTLKEKRQRNIAEDIIHHFEKRIHQSEKKPKAKITHRKDGVEIRIGDTLIENNLDSRMKQLWTKISS